MLNSNDVHNNPVIFNIQPIVTGLTRSGPWGGRNPTTYKEELDEDGDK